MYATQHGHAAFTELIVHERTQADTHTVMIIDDGPGFQGRFGRGLHDGIVESTSFVKILGTSGNSEAWVDHRTPRIPMGEMRLETQIPSGVDGPQHGLGHGIVGRPDMREVGHDIHGGPDLR